MTNEEKIDEYRREVERLNQLNVALTRDITDERNKVDLLTRAMTFYVGFWLDTFDGFADVALTSELLARRIEARNLMANVVSVPM